MANMECDLQVGSYRQQSKGYEEILVPALEPRPLAPDEKLVKIADMPDWAHKAFEGMQHLNRVQSRVYETALFKADNILLCAPTGAGKTNVAVLTILQQIALNRNPDGSFNQSNYKIVYVAPMKALVTEIVRNLSNRLGGYGVNVKELSGDKTLTRQQIEDIKIIVTTPEEWDLFTRKRGNLNYTQLVKLLIIDGMHLLHDNRGPALESIVARTVRQIETTKEHIRLVGLSATLPNYEDVAQFLHVDVEKGLFHFDNSYRPVPLSQRCIGITEKQPLQRFQLMNRICYEKVMSVAGEHQVLIFVQSREETAETARAIRDSAFANNTMGRFLKEDSASRHILQRHAELVESNDLKDLLCHGFAVHHDGMTRVDCLLVEGLFADGYVQVLVSIATVDWYVKSPAHTVIVKGTKRYNPLDVMQMLGRAGRPQIDSSGEGIIITGHNELEYYSSLMNQQLHVESQFISKLADQLNAEITLAAVQNTREACNWFGYTYLYFRMLRNPTLYGLDPDVLTKDTTLEQKRSDLIHLAATALDKNNLIKYDRESGDFQVTDLGRIASYYYITHRTISTYNENLKPKMDSIELFRLFSLSEEFKNVTVRQDEKVELAWLLERVPVPIKDNLEEPSAKINVLLQAYITQLKLKGLSLTSDMEFITQSAGRLMRALFENVLKKGWPQVAEKALDMCKMINKRMWCAHHTPLRQFHGIPIEILKKLDDLETDKYYDLSPQEIGELISSPKMGRTLHKFIRQIPKLDLAARVQPITHTVVRVELTIKPDFQWEDEVHGYVEPFWLIVKDNEGEIILHNEYFELFKQYIDKDHRLSFIVPISEPLPPQYFIHVVSDKWLGSQTILELSLRHLILPAKHQPPTELLDLQPLSVTALKNPSYEALYQDFEHFNPVQTQAFDSLYNSDINVLIAAPSGCGKTICAELAILRYHQKRAGRLLRAVYIAPLEEIAKERYHDWSKKFGQGLGVPVVELTGQTMTDLKLLEKGGIIISTPEKWDALSRRWKEREFVQKVRLFIIDELQLIGGQGGPVIEVIVSRMRCIARQFNTRIRIVALSPSLANAGDLGRWLGASSRGLFNFAPGPCTKYNLKFLHEEFPVESQLHLFLHNYLNAEIVSGLVNNTQDAVEWLTQTFMFRRLQINPNFYQLHAISNKHVSDYLSELIENTLRDLEECKCVFIEANKLSPWDLGLIASDYYISYKTAEHFSSSLTPKANVWDLLEILASASEYSELPIRPGERDELEKLIHKLNRSFQFKNLKLTDPHMKAKVLLGTHILRQPISGMLALDQREVLLPASRLILAMVDVFATHHGRLDIARSAMNLSQMVTQAMSLSDCYFLQIPHFTDDLAIKYWDSLESNKSAIADLLEMEDGERRDLLQLTDPQLLDIMRFCKRYPKIAFLFDVRAEENVTLVVTLKRDLEDMSEVGPVDAPRFPAAKEEGWWLVVVGDNDDQLLAIKRVVCLQRQSKVKLRFPVPLKGKVTLSVKCDSYCGLDFTYTFDVKAGDKFQDIYD